MKRKKIRKLKKTRKRKGKMGRKREIRQKECIKRGGGRPEGKKVPKKRGVLGGRH